MLLDPAEIDKERGVVIEEWRGGLGAASRLRDQQIPVLYYQSKYAERLPIGKPEILKSFTPDRLRAFYTKWYRPDRMAVVVVGDVDPAEDGGDDSCGVRRAREAGDAGARSRSIDVPLPVGGALQGGDRSGGDAVVGVARAEEGRGCRRTASRTTAATWSTGSCSR